MSLNIVHFLINEKEIILTLISLLESKFWVKQENDKYLEWKDKQWLEIDDKY